MTVASKPSYCLLPQVVTPDIVIIVEGDVCPAGFRSPTYNLLEGIQSSLCDLPTFDDWAIINGADCRLLGNGYGCKLAKTQDPVAGQTLCVPCSNSSCVLVSKVTPKAVKIVDIKSSCPPGYGTATYHLLEGIKSGVCDLPTVEDWAIINGADCRLLGNGYGCELAKQQDPVAEEMFCAPCTSCPLPSHIDAEHMKLVNGTVCPHSTALVTYEPLKHNMDKLCAKLDPRTIVNGFNCSLMGSHFGCKVSDKYNPSAETVLCAPCDL